MQSMLAGKPPPVKIEGDVQLAAELGWLAETCAGTRKKTSRA
jgi:ubiquinone biosynthesis protein UbiJ